MRIDAHQHFWNYTPTEYQWIRHPALMHDFEPNNLAPLLQSCGFDGTIAVQARSTLAETQWLLELATEHPFIKGVVGWADLCDPDLRTHLSSVSTNPTFCGVRTGIRVEPGNPQHINEDFLEGMGVLGEFDATFDILIQSTQLTLASALVERFPSQVFILDHIANPMIKSGLIEPWETDIRQLANFSNVYCKVSGMVTRADHDSWQKQDFPPYLKVVFDAFSPGRLMIGSDWPVCTQAANYGETMGIVLDYVAGLSQAEQDAVLGGNAVRAYGVDVSQP